MTDPDPLGDAATALGPKKSTGDTGSIEQFTVEELIAYDKYMKGVAAVDVQPTSRGLRFNKIIPGGSA